MGQPHHQLRPIVLSAGEPAGVAPEITAKAWMALHEETTACFCLIGDAEVFSNRAKTAGQPVPFIAIADLAQAATTFAHGVPVLHRAMPAQSLAGQLDKRNANWVIAQIDEAVVHCLSGAATAMVTNPIQKETLYSVGFKHQGHTDYIADLARRAGHVATDVMMLVGADLRAVPITVHIPLADVPKILTAEMIAAQGRVVAQSLSRWFGIASPRIAVTGLNPHAGENGAMGLEDKLVVAPAVMQMQRDGINAFGPLSADTAFHPEARAMYDAILCMYHDQALIPVKTLDFHGGVNVTLGLPFIRTSPDHGTALNIAGTGKANATSLVAAIRLAAAMAQQP